MFYPHRHSCFRLAERHRSAGGSDSKPFQTAIVSGDLSQEDHLLLPATLTQFQIIVHHSAKKVFLWVDPRLTTLGGDLNLPHRLISKLELVAQQIVSGDQRRAIGDLNYFSSADQTEADARDPPLKPAMDGLLHELNVVSGRLALQLQAAGVSRGIIAPLLFEKSAYTHVLQLAALKAGAAFAMLSIDVPVARMKMIVDQLDGKDHQPCQLGLSSPSLSTLLATLVPNVIPIDAERAWVKTRCGQALQKKRRGRSHLKMRLTLISPQERLVCPKELLSSIGIFAAPPCTLEATRWGLPPQKAFVRRNICRTRSMDPAMKYSSLLPLVPVYPIRV